MTAAGCGRSAPSLCSTTFGSNVGVDFSFWKLHIEPMAGANLIAVNRITRGALIADLPWQLGVHAGPSFAINGSHLAVDLDVRLSMLSTVAHPGYGLRLCYQFF